MAPPRHVVPTDLLAAALRPRLALLERRLAEAEMGAGAQTILAERAAPALGIKPASVLRALDRVLAERTEATSADLADALLLNLAGVRIGDLLPTLPGTAAGAEEMVDTYYELHGEPESVRERAELAERLLGFARGFLADAGELALAA